jgi:hypothetical protein
MRVDAISLRLRASVGSAGGIVAGGIPATFSAPLKEVKLVPRVVHFSRACSTALLWHRDSDVHVGTRSSATTQARLKASELVAKIRPTLVVAHRRSMENESRHRPARAALLTSTLDSAAILMNHDPATRPGEVAASCARRARPRARVLNSDSVLRFDSGGFRPTPASTTSKGASTRRRRLPQARDLKRRPARGWRQFTRILLAHQPKWSRAAWPSS